MRKHAIWWYLGVFGIMVCLCALGLGCANQPKQDTSVQPSVQDVRGDSDRFFQRMGQEETAQPSSEK